MSLPTHVTDIPLTLRLSDAARAKLAERAQRSGQDVAIVVSQLIEKAVARSSIDEVLAPFRKQVEASGLSDDQLDAFFRSEIEAHRQSRKAASS